MLNNLLRNTKAYLRKAGIELTAPFTLKTFRKSFAQNHAGRGTPPRTLAELLGHSDVSVTMEHYNRVTDANKRAAAQTRTRCSPRQPLIRRKRRAELRVIYA